jgi:uncharacterized protein YkwD
MLKKLFSITLLLFSFSVIGCPKPPSPPAPTPTPVDNDYEFEKGIFRLTNLQRKNNGLAELKENSKLTLAARKYAQLMRERQTLSHQVDGLTLSERVNAVDYRWRTIGENIARGYNSPERVMTGWMNSSGHRRNILNANYKEIGIGVAGTWQCQIFAAPR